MAISNFCDISEYNERGAEQQIWQTNNSMESSIIVDGKAKQRSNNNALDNLNVPSYNIENSVYRDFSYIDSNKIMTILKHPVCKRKGPRGGVVLPFPVRLFDMLQAVEKVGQDYIVAWAVHGRCFELRCVPEFVEKIMPK